MTPAPHGLTRREATDAHIRALALCERVAAARPCGHRPRVIVERTDAGRIVAYSVYLAPLDPAYPSLTLVSDDNFGQLLAAEPGWFGAPEGFGIATTTITITQFDTGESVNLEPEEFSRILGSQLALYQATSRLIQLEPETRSRVLSETCEQAFTVQAQHARRRACRHCRDGVLLPPPVGSEGFGTWWCESCAMPDGQLLGPGMLQTILRILEPLPDIRLTSVEPLGTDGYQVVVSVQGADVTLSTQDDWDTWAASAVAWPEPLAQP